MESTAVKLLVTGACPDAPALLARMDSAGYAGEYWADERVAPPRLGDYQAIVCNALLQHHPLPADSRLRFLQLTSAGTERIPLPALLARGVLVANARGVYSIPIAEWVLLKILEIYKNSRHFYAAQREGRWEKRRDLLELAGKTVGIVGYGSIGRATAKRLQACDAQVIGFDLAAPCDDYLDAGYPIAALPARLAECDTVVLTLPLTAATRHLFNDQLFARMRDGTILVNVARGGVIDEGALLRALQAGTLLGAALDVFEQEPLPPDSPLWSRPEVLVSPHNAFVSECTQARLTALIEENLLCVARGEAPCNLVNAP